MPRQPAQQKVRVAPSISQRQRAPAGLALPQWKQRDASAERATSAPETRAPSLSRNAEGIGIGSNLRRARGPVNLRNGAASALPRPLTSINAHPMSAVDNQRSAH